MTSDLKIITPLEGGRYFFCDVYIKPESIKIPLGLKSVSDIGGQFDGASSPTARLFALGLSEGCALSPSQEQII